jgi:hypothetical protein
LFAISLRQKSRTEEEQSLPKPMSMRKSEKVLPGRKEESEGLLQRSMSGVRSEGAFQQPSSRVLGDSKSRLVPSGIIPVICVFV